MEPFPWADMTRPDPGTLCTKRAIIKSNSPHEIYYAIDDKENYLLIYILPSDCRESFNDHLLYINISRKKVGGKSSVIVHLLDKEEASLFYWLCLDLINHMDRAVFAQGPRAFKNRLNFLKRFLKPRSEALSAIEQQGLFGELMILRNVVLEHYRPYTAVNMWYGEEGLPQDFIHSKILLEVKSILVPRKKLITISSPEQLDGGERYLYLVVVYMEPSDPDILGSYSLFTLIKDIQAILMQDDNALDLFNTKLSSKIPSSILDTNLLKKYYDNDYYKLYAIEYYDVNDNFPKIVRNNLPEQVMNLSYVINLEKCTDFIIDEEAMFKNIG